MRLLSRLLLVVAAAHARALALGSRPAAPPRCAATIRSRVHITLQEEPLPLEEYNDAEARGLELFGSGEYERAIRMFELVRPLAALALTWLATRSA